MDEKLRKRGGCCRDATFPWPWWGNYMPAVELGTLAPGQDEWLDCIPVGHNAPVATVRKTMRIAIFFHAFLPR